MTNTEFDYLIIGQGLAGSILAYQLIKSGQKVMVIDNQHHGSSSKVAAGIINPVTGHRFNLSDGFSQFYPPAKAFYQQLENQLDASFFRELKQTRLLKNAGQQEYFKQRQQQAEYDSIICHAGQHIFAENSNVTGVKQTAAVDTKALLSAVKTWLESQQAYTTSQVDYSKISFTKQSVAFDSFIAKKIIFCEGYQAINNPWLKDLPFKLSKGEILTLSADKLASDSLFSWGSWLVTDKNGNTAKLGSNYDWNSLNLKTNSEVKNKLLDSLIFHTNVDATVTDHEAGIRPTTTQRKPFIGVLPNQPQAVCFNGFGSKGCLSIPFYAELLCEHLLHDEPLPEELTQWL